ncbi:hypothetical protein ACJX0J_022710 [Zea mays]
MDSEQSLGCFVSIGFLYLETPSMKSGIIQHNTLTSVELKKQHSLATCIQIKDSQEGGLRRIQLSTFAIIGDIPHITDSILLRAKTFPRLSISFNLLIVIMGYMGWLIIAPFFFLFINGVVRD